MTVIDRWRLKLRFKLWARLRVNHFSSFNLSHSQFGEDMVVRSMLEHVKNGTYVDVGAHHPVFYSNTYHFYCKGWSGLNIDATPGSMEPFRVLRPRDINVEACLSPIRGQSVTFHVFDQPAFNTTDPAAAETAIASGQAHLTGKHTLTTMTLGDCLDAHLKGRKIDLLSIDVEGLDEAILRSNDWSRYKPGVLIFESHGLSIKDIEQSAIGEMFATLGYKCAAQCGPSLIMVAERG